MTTTTPEALDTPTAHAAPAATAAFVQELAQVLVEALNLETPADQIDPAAPLFHDGLGLDSIDMLELSLVIAQRYGCRLRSDDPDNRRIFSSLQALADHVVRHRTP
jgi:acyl carrier protein